MDLFQLEQSCWATLKANKMHVKSVFSAESIKIMGPWYVMQWYLPSWWNLVFPSSGLEGKNSCTLKREAAGSSKLFRSIYQTSWNHIPWLYSQQTEVPITYHMARFNIHEHQGRWTALWIPQKICSKFLTSQTTWRCPVVSAHPTPGKVWDLVIGNWRLTCSNRSDTASICRAEAMSN